MTNQSLPYFNPDPCLYSGTVTHIRHGAVEHKLTYRVASLLLPLHKTEYSEARSPLFSINRFNLISFHDADHMDDGFDSLDAFIDHQLIESGQFAEYETRPTKFTLLAFPRLLGHTFNPLTIIFCCDVEDRLQAILYQVSNTFGQRHHYLYRLQAAEAETLFIHDGEKNFYVSPFLDMKGKYEFAIRLPDKRAIYRINMHGDQPSSLSAYYSAERRTLTTKGLLATFGLLGQTGWKTLGAIHYEAIKLWFKGAPFHRKPPLPIHLVTRLRNSASIMKEQRHDAAE